MQGLSNRRTGATSINAESSRSHSVFTCVVESRCKVLVLVFSFSPEEETVVFLPTKIA